MQVSEQQIERFVQFADKRNDMVQDGKSQEIDETDGLPFPQRIWAVVPIGFALCMSVLDIMFRF